MSVPRDDAIDPFFKTSELSKKLDDRAGLFELSVIGEKTIVVHLQDFVIKTRPRYSFELAKCPLDDVGCVAMESSPVDYKLDRAFVRRP